MHEGMGAHATAAGGGGRAAARLASPFRPSSGVVSYDRAMWSKWLPQVRHAAWQGEVACILQVAPDAAGVTEIEVPAAPSTAVLFWTRGQTVRFKLDGAEHRVRSQPWQFTVVPGGCRSWWVGAGEDLGGVLHLHLDEALLQRVAQDQGLTSGAALLEPRALQSDRVINEAGAWLLQETGAERQPSRLLLDTVGAAVAFRLLAPDTRATAPLAGGLAPWQIKRVQDYVEAHLGEEISLQSLAGLIGVSVFHLCRAFKRSAGVAPHRWLVDRRMEAAARLLCETDRPIIDIAAQVGYSNASAFSTAFKKQRGVSPHEYRRLRRL